MKEYNIDEMIKRYGIDAGTEELDKLDVKIEGLDFRKNREEVKSIIRARRLERQKNILVGLVKGTADKTHLKELLNIALHEIDQQTAIKQNIETKAGVLLTFIGVMVSIIFQSDKVVELIPEMMGQGRTSIHGWLICLVVIVWGLSGGLAVFFAIMILLGRNYSILELDNKMLEAATIDENVSLAALLETTWQVVNRNMAINDRKGKYLNLMIGCLGVFVLSTIFFFILFVWHGQF